MSTFEHIIRQAQRRQLASLALRRSGWGVCIAFVAALILLVIDRIANLHLSPFVFGGIVAAGFISGWVQATLSGADRLAVAVQLDRSLRLKDRLGTAQAVRDVAKAPVHHDEDFASLVQRDAQKLADSIDVRSVTPIRITGIWGTALSLAFVLSVGFRYLPSLEWATHERSAEHVALTNKQTQEQAREMTQVVSQAIADVPKGGLDSKAQEGLAALDRLMQQMSNRQASPEQVDAARDESAARLDELAERMAEQSQRDKAASDELAKRFSGIDQTGAPKPPLSTKEFSEALKRGDFGAAAEKLDELLKSASVPEDDRRAAAEHMRDLAKRIDQANQGPVKDQTAQELREHFSQALRDQGLDEETIDELMENPPQSPEQIAQELQRNNVDEEIAHDLARDIDRLREENDVDEQVKQDTRDVSEALDRAADEVENPPPSPGQQPPATSEPDHQQQSEPPTSQPQQSPPETPQHDQAQRDQTQKQQQQDGRQASDKSNSGKDQSSSQKQPSESSQQQSQKQDERQSTQPDRTVSSQNRDRSREQGAPQQQQSGASTKPQGQSTQNRDRPRNEGAAESQPSNQQTSDRSTDKPDRATERQGQQQQQQDKPSSDNSVKQGSGKPTPSTQPRDQQSPKSTERSDQPQDAKRDSANNPQQATRDQQQQQSADPDSPNQQQQQQGQSAQQKDDQSNQQSPSDVLRRLAERQGNANDREQSAEKLRELAKQFMKNTTPEQRKQWAEQWLKENGKQQQDQQDTRQTQKNPQQNPANEPPSEDQQKLAKELEDIARELAKDMSPEERREWMERAEKLRQQQQANRQPDPSVMADDNDNPASKDDPAQPPSAGSASKGSRTGEGRLPQTDDSPQRLTQDGSDDNVDLRGRETADRIIAQWLSDRENPKTQDAQRGVAEAPASIRRAQDVAQRAVNDSAVQKRYHNTIKRYFGRLNETIKKAAGGNAAPAPAATPPNGAPGVVPEAPAPPPAPAPDPGKSP